MKKMLLFIGIVLMLGACSNLKADESKRPFVHVVEEPMIIEYTGEDKEVVIEPQNVLTSNSDLNWLGYHSLLIEDVNIRYNQIGNYQVRIAFENSELNMIYDVIVRDTVAPDLQVQDVTVEQDSSIDINSFVISSSDLSGIKEVRFVSDVDLVSVGTRNYQIVAIDNNGLETVKDVSLTINEKPVVQYQSPVNNWSSGSNASSGGGSSNNQAPQPQKPTTLTPTSTITHSTKESCEIDLQALFDKQGGGGGCNGVYAIENGSLMGWELVYWAR